MSDISLFIPMQYVLHSSAESFVRPYEITSGLSNTFELWLDIQPLTQVNCWSLVLEASVTGKLADSSIGLVTCCAIQAIVELKGIPDEEIDSILRMSAAPLVLGSVRSLLATLSNGTGLGTVVLPPMTAESVAALSAKSKQ